MPFIPGDRLGRYEIVRSLSTGETDELHHGREPSLVVVQNWLANLPSQTRSR